MATLARRIRQSTLRAAPAAPTCPPAPTSVNAALLPTLKGHLASKPVPLPPSVRVTTTPAPASARTLTVSGPRGTQTFPLFDGVYVDAESDPTCARVTSTHDGSQKQHRAQWGLVRALLNNMVTGVTHGFVSNLRLVGVGYRAATELNEQGRQRLRMKLGFSHDVVMDVPEGVEADVPRPTEITLSSTRKDVLGQFAANIRQWRKPEPYNGKGIFINDETIRLKTVKR